VETFSSVDNIQNLGAMFPTLMDIFDVKNTNDSLTTKERGGKLLLLLKIVGNMIEKMRFSIRKYINEEMQ
jgi:hypothetical protein